MLLFLLAISFLFTINAAFRKHGKSALYCEKVQHSHICFDIDKPVAAFTTQGDYTIYSNPCSACSDPRISFYFELTRCPETFNSQACNKKEKFCTVHLDNSLDEYDNLCDACDLGAEMHFKGACPYYGEYIQPSHLDDLFKKRSYEMQKEIYDEY